MSNQGNIRVLIAEDDCLVGEMIKGLLEEAGYTVVGEAMDGLETVEMTQSLQPNIVLMDIRMPDVDGIEATQLIYERCPTPVVVLTAYETEELVEGASAAGVGAYLVKPPKLREMERAIAIAMARFGDMMKLRGYAGQLEQRVQRRTVQLQAKCARLEAILRSASDGIVVTNGQGEIIQANPVAQAWLTQTLSPDEAARLQEAVQALAQRAGERPQTVLELAGLDLELRAAPISEPVTTLSGEAKATAVVDIHDVSHLKALNRMKSRFIANMSHELRTPVTTLKLYLALMQRTEPEEWKKHLDTLTQEVNWLARLAEDVMQISRIDTGRLEMEPCPTPLNELTRVTIANLGALAQERGLTLQRRPAEPEPVALVDPDRLTQVLDKLVGNAILYTPEGGQVVVSTGTEEAEGRVWATVTVSDTGMGIPDEELPHIFGRFFRGEKPQTMQLSGTGLGLAIVKEIVELHGGRVTVESEVDEGSAFTVWLPLADAGEENGE